MEAHWVWTADRYPAENREVWLIVVGPGGDIEYGKGRIKNGHWDFTVVPLYPRVIGWVETNDDLTKAEVDGLSKEGVKC